MVAGSELEIVANKCALLIQMPSSLDTYQMLRRTINVNCFNYYHVAVPTDVLSLVESDYNSVIVHVNNYEAMYALNEHTLFNIKAWMSMDAADPLTAVQRTLKECNAQLLVSFFGHEDIRASLPTFVSSISYMLECFQSVFVEASEQRTSLLKSYLNKEANAHAASAALKQSFSDLTIAQNKLQDTRDVFRDYITKSQITVESLYN
jgi:hypothetical protein